MSEPPNNIQLEASIVRLAYSSIIYSFKHGGIAMNFKC